MSYEYYTSTTEEQRASIVAKNEKDERIAEMKANWYTKYDKELNDWVNRIRDNPLEQMNVLMGS